MSFIKHFTFEINLKVLQVKEYIKKTTMLCFLVNTWT